MEIQEGRAEQDPDRNSRPGRPGIRHRSKRDDCLSSRIATCRSLMHFSMTSWTCREVPPGQDSVSGDRRRRRSGPSIRLASSDPRARLSSCACKAHQPAGPDRARMPEVRSGPAHAVRHQAPAKPSHPGPSQRKAVHRQPWLAASPGDGHAPVGGSHESVSSPRSNSTNGQDPTAPSCITRQPCLFPPTTGPSVTDPSALRHIRCPCICPSPQAVGEASDRLQPCYRVAPKAAERSGCSSTPAAPSWRAPTNAPVTTPGSSPAAKVETNTSVPASGLTSMV